MAAPSTESRLISSLLHRASLLEKADRLGDARRLLLQADQMEPGRVGIRARLESLDRRIAAQEAPLLENEASQPSPGLDASLGGSTFSQASPRPRNRNEEREAQIEEELGGLFDSPLGMHREPLSTPLHLRGRRERGERPLAVWILSGLILVPSGLAFFLMLTVFLTAGPLIFFMPPFTIIFGITSLTLWAGINFFNGKAWACRTVMILEGLGILLQMLSGAPQMWRILASMITIVYLLVSEEVAAFFRE